MTTTTQTTTNQVNAGYEASRFALGVAITSVSIVGLWACACVASAIMNDGIVQVVKGLLGAIS